MADASTCELNATHSPTDHAFHAFNGVNAEIKHELIRLRHHWNQHEPRMFAKAEGLSDHELVGWTIEKDLVKIRSGVTAYGTHLFGIIRIPALQDGYVHVRVISEGPEKVKFHSISTDEVKDGEGKIIAWNAIQTSDKELEWFNE